MQRAGKIVPIVGDFAGDHALAQLASYLKGESRKVGVFYVANGEQYLLEPKIWKKWVRNVKELPKTEQALFLRGYLDHIEARREWNTHYLKRPGVIVGWFGQVQRLDIGLPV